MRKIIGSALVSADRVNWNAATGVLVSEKVTLEFDVAAVRQS